MGVKVGIPRALGYHYMFPFYKTFLEHLGAQIVVSPPTSKSTLDRMCCCPTDEPCVSVKLYFAHTQALLEMDVDFIWSPVLASMTPHSFCCPKFLGISDMIRNGLRIDRDKLLVPRFDRRLNPDQAKKSFFDVAHRLGVKDSGRVYHALGDAYSVQKSAETAMVTWGMTPPRLFERIEDIARMSSSGGPDLLDAVLDPLPRIGVIGHSYLLHDMLSHNLVERLGEFGRVITAEMVSRAEADAAMETIPEGRRMWYFEARLLGAAIHLMRNRLVNKLVLVTSFECGPASIIESYIDHEAFRQAIPFLLLTIDEQTGEAGLVTRIEAFMDTSAAHRPRGLSSDSDLSGRKRGASTNPNGALDTESARLVGLGACAHQNADSIEGLPMIRPSHYPPPLGDLVVGFPSMGYLDIAVRAILEDCGTKCIDTPRTNKRVIELGAELAPEFACFPLTATLGQMRILLEKGANTIFMIGGKGRCRLGWYGQVQANLLRNAGYDFDMLVIDSPLPLRENWAQFRDILKRLTGGAPWRRIIKSFWYGYRKLLALDRAEEICRKLRAVERDRGSVDKLFSGFVRRMEHVTDMGSVNREFCDYEGAAAAIETESIDPIKVRIVGEIWVVLEHVANQQIEKMLARQDRIRVEVDRELSASQWFRQNVFRDPAMQARERQICRAAAPYLSEEIGGHGMETIGATVLAREEGCDGVVHVMPFTCMPEIVAQNILVAVSEDLDIPVLTHIVSEQTAETGMHTRVEAFLDILEERRRSM
jgi:predicted nucleotide-binding protein (sugar kinase/HSP70/actin superfamily)